MKALVRLIKWLIITAVALGVLIAAGLYGNALYSGYLANKALTLRTGVSDWQWQKDKSYGDTDADDVQWRISEEFGYVMRRVYGDHEVAARLSKTEDGKLKLHAQAYWQAGCVEDTSIETSVTYDDGLDVTLTCLKQDWGNELTTAVVFSDVTLYNLPTWYRNFDGFEVNEDFDGYVWDFQPAVRHLTLQSAKPTEGAE
jgi:hypothetical protein